MHKKTEERRTQTHSVLHTKESSAKCTACRTAIHPLSTCTKFKRALRKDKWRIVKVNKLCHNCLLPGHSKEACSASTCDVDECGMAHHRLLHWPAK
ncbi:unnamed protein product [Arctia plantaginis]|uniref:Uncharacterized protein n=1 Tax=Arctia plantaginis TaxID=874455 RepID=A0A8S1B5A4_ARCPL|nr:unnamed protein product [Arctia plantaginis]